MVTAKRDITGWQYFEYLAYHPGAIQPPGLGSGPKATITDDDIESMRKVWNSLVANYGL